MQGRKTRPIGVEGKHRAIAISATPKRRPIQGIARQGQTGWHNSVAVGIAGSRIFSLKREIRGRESMQGHKTRAIGVEGEHGAIAR